MITAGQDGQRLYILNTGSYAITMSTNLVNWKGGACVLPANALTELMYSGTLSKWVEIARSTISTVTAVQGSAYQASAQSLTSGSLTTIHLDTALDDPGGFLNTYALVAPQDGWYTAAGVASFAAHADAARRLVQITRNSDSLVLAQNAVPAINSGSIGTTVNIATRPFYLSSGDKIYLVMRQDSGSTINTIAGNTATYLSLQYVGA